MTIRHVALYHGDGSLLGNRWLQLGPCQWRQENSIFHHVTNDDLESAFAVITTPTEDALYFAYASVVDNNTGDPFYIAGEAASLPFSK